MAEANRTEASGVDAPRRQRLSADQRRDQLVSAAVEVLAERGFRATSADEIARRAGVSKGLLWHYFTDLDDLFETVARRTLAALAQAVGAAIDLDAPAPQLIRAAIHAAAGLRRTHGQQRHALNEIVLNLRAADGSSRFDLQDYEQMYTAQEGIFRRGQDDGDFRPGADPRVLAVTYQGAVDAMLGYLDAHPEIDADAFADSVADTLLLGLCLPAGPGGRVATG